MINNWRYIQEMINDLSRFQEMINEVDADGSGSIDFSEFLNMMSKKVEETSVIEDQVRRAFKVLATSGKGRWLYGLKAWREILIDS